MKAKFKVTKALAAKVLSTVDMGLCSGLGQPEPGKMCVEAAVCYAMGLPHGDNPTCVSKAVRQLKITLNDAQWSSNEARAKGMRRLAIAQLGTADVIDDIDFVKRVAKLTIEKVVPRALRHAAKVHPDQKHRDALEAAAIRCEKEGGTDADAAAAARYAAAAAAADAARYAADAARYAAAAARYAAADARYAADAARYAAAAARYAAAADNELSLYAEEVVQILVDMKAPGTKFLSLTE